MKVEKKHKWGGAFIQALNDAKMAPRKFPEKRELLRKQLDLRVLWCPRLWAAAVVVVVAPAVVCSEVHICVESWSTVGLDGDGVDVLRLVRGGAVKPTGTRPFRLACFRGVARLPEAPPVLGLAVVVTVDRVLPLPGVTVFAAWSTVGVVVMVVVVAVVVVVVVVVSGPLGTPLGLERKMGSCPIRLASTRSVGT